jgi:hypothetical protein
MNGATFTVLFAGSAAVSTLVWLYLVAVMVREFGEYAV